MTNTSKLTDFERGFICGYTSTDEQDQMRSDYAGELAEFCGCSHADVMGAFKMWLDNLSSNVVAGVVKHGMEKKQ